MVILIFEHLAIASHSQCCMPHFYFIMRLPLAKMLSGSKYCLIALMAPKPGSDTVLPSHSLRILPTETRNKVNLNHLIFILCTLVVNSYYFDVGERVEGQPYAT